MCAGLSMMLHFCIVVCDAVKRETKFHVCRNVVSMQLWFVNCYNASEEELLFKKTKKLNEEDDFLAIGQ